MDFKAATTTLTSTPAITLADVAKAFGKDTHTIARARMEGENARRPPSGWQPVLADLARQHAATLGRHIKELQRLAEVLEAQKPK